MTTKNTSISTSESTIINQSTNHDQISTDVTPENSSVDSLITAKPTEHTESESSTTEENVNDTSTEKVNSEALTKDQMFIIGGAGGACLILIVLTAIFFTYRKRNQRSSQPKLQNHHPIPENVPLFEAKNNANRTRSSAIRSSFSRKPLVTEANVEMFHLPGIVDDRPHVIRD